jgi:hypothetical protein
MPSWSWRALKVLAVIGTSSEARGTVYVDRRKKEPRQRFRGRVYAGALDSARDTKSLRGNEYPAKVTKSFLAPTRSGRRPRFSRCDTEIASSEMVFSSG